MKNIKTKMRSGLFMKFFFYITFSSLIVLSYISLRDIRNTNQMLEEEKAIVLQKLFENSLLKVEETKEKELDNSTDNIKYILQWTNPKNVPFVYMGEGRQGFIDRECPYTNCYVTANRTLLGDYVNFDVIAFAGPEVVNYSPAKLPARRSQHQKFAFASIESGDNYPICNKNLNGFFNWTWTFKLDSDARWGYLVIRDKNDKIIGPNKVMHWMTLEDMDPVSEQSKEKLKTKKKAAAWFVSNCFTRSKREVFVKELQAALMLYDLNVDIYGKCGPHKCPSENSDECAKMIKTDYYFYLSFENSFDEDYVTEKLLHGLRNNAVPIVFGGANYTRFMPDGIYLNAKELGADALALKMHELINKPEEYYEYFRWQNHYSYHRRNEDVTTDDYCRFCSMLNEEDLVTKRTVYEDFKKWWTPSHRC